MKLNDQRIVRGLNRDLIYEKRISQIGINKFLKELETQYLKDSISHIDSCFDNFKKDILCYPFSLNTNFKNSKTKEVLDYFKIKKNNLPIFNIEDDNLKYNIKFPIIPFNNFFISSNAYQIIEDEMYLFGGFFISKICDTHSLVIYIWSRVLKEGWAINSFMSKTNSLETPFEKQIIDFGFTDENKDNFIQKIAIEKFDHLMKKLIYKIDKKEYNSYKVHSHGIYILKEISRDIRSHKRHFWKDSGKFKIPTWSKEKIISEGYEIAELAYRGGTLRMNVPFKIISKKKSEMTQKNKKYNLIEKKVWKSEQKVYQIIKDLFQDKLIRRHDRKKLNGLELDIYLPELRLGIEYDGEQHFDKRVCEEVFKSDFESLLKRDRRKDKLCRRKKIVLLRIKYNNPLTKKFIKKKLVTLGFFQ